MAGVGAERMYGSGSVACAGSVAVGTQQLKIN